MQMIQTCGLTIQHYDISHNQYLNFKDEIEKFGNDCVEMAKACGKIPFMRYILVKEHYYLTCCVTNYRTEIAVYDSTSKTLIQDFTPDSPVILTKRLIDQLYVKMYNYSKTAGNPTIKNLQDAWDKLLFEKEMQQERE